MKHLSEILNGQGQELFSAEQVLNALPLSCYVLDKEERFVYLNTSMEAFLQKNREELVGKTLEEIFQNTLPATYYSAIRNTLSDGKNSTCDYYSGTSEKWISVTITPVTEMIVVCCTETSGSMEKDQLLETEKQKLNEVQSIANLGSYSYDVASDSVIWSDQTYKIMGIDTDVALTFEKALAIYKPSDAEKLIELCSGALNSGTGFEMDAIIEVGVPKWEKYIYIKAEPIQQANGEITGLSGVVQDITMIKQAQQKIIEDAAMIKGIADAAPDMLYVIDFTEMRMIYANNNVLRLFGKTLQELSGLGAALFDIVVYPEDRPAFDLHMQALLLASEGEVKELTFRMIDAEGRPRWVKTRRTIYRRDRNGMPTHAVSVSQDVSEQIRLQEENNLLELQKREMELMLQKRIFQVTLDTQEKERKRIAERIHNELGQLLYGVKLSLARLRLSEPIQSNRDYLDVLERTGKLLGEAIRESRKISHELMPAILEAYGLIAAIEDIGSRFNDITSFKVELSGMDQRLEHTQEIAVYRIVQELMLNIVKHAKANMGYVSLKRTESEICIKVSDNGIGFSEETLNKSGTGLANIMNKISLLKGEVSITSDPGQNTMVMVTLPLL